MQPGRMQPGHMQPGHKQPACKIERECALACKWPVRMQPERKTSACKFSVRKTERGEHALSLHR
jgi:hypothetical protein